MFTYGVSLFIVVLALVVDFVVVVVDVIRKQALKNDRKPSKNEPNQMVILHTMTVHRCTMIMG